jgi:hypothetical protein
VGGVITARPFNHSGPGQKTQFVLSSIAKQFVEIEAGSRPAKLICGNIDVELILPTFATSCALTPRWLKEAE